MTDKEITKFTEEICEKIHNNNCCVAVMIVDIESGGGCAHICSNIGVAAMIDLIKEMQREIINRGMQSLNN